MERQSGTGTVSCLSATTGPLVDQIRRGVGNIVLKANAEGKVCQPRVGSCDRISDYGTAGFRICSIVQAGLPPACWDPYWLSRKFLEIATTCPETDPGSIWSRVNGEYSVAVGELPNGTSWIFDISIENDRAVVMD